MQMQGIAATTDSWLSPRLCCCSALNRPIDEHDRRMRRKQPEKNKQKQIKLRNTNRLTKCNTIYRTVQYNNGCISEALVHTFDRKKQPKNKQITTKIKQQTMRTSALQLNPLIFCNTNVIVCTFDGEWRWVLVDFEIVYVLRPVYTQQHSGEFGYATECITV